MFGRALVLGIACSAIAVAFFVVAPKPTHGPALRDFEAYYAAGATWRYRGDPYGRDVWRVEREIPAVVATRDELLPFVGPPYGLPFWELLARLPWRSAVGVWGTLLALAFGTIALASLRLAGGRSDPFDALAVLVFCTAFGPLTSGVALGQVAMLACAAIFVMPFALRPRLTLVAGACALVAALQPNLAVVLVARLADTRAWLAFAGAAAIGVLGSMLALGGPAGALQYVAVLRAHAAAERFTAIQTTAAAVTRGFGAPAALATGIAAAVTLLTVVILALQTWRGRYAPDDRLVLACAAWPLGLPFAHEHDFALAVLPSVVVLRRARGAYWLSAAFATLAIGIDWLGLAQRPHGVWATSLLAAAAGLAMMALARERLRPRHFVPLSVALAVIVAGVISTAHPLATWPDALPSGFRVAHAASAAEVWRAEQELSGIAAFDPWWSALRLVPLGGCALLWFVAAVVLREPVTDPQPAQRSEPSSTARRPPAATYPSA